MSRSIPAKRILPLKEASLFKEILHLYEIRQLKKSLKAADQILKKFPEHGETLCMKGLVLTHMGRREEGIDLVKQGMRLDLTSHICWHVFGLIQKGEKNYEEALKSYTQALKFDRENLNILRDTAHLQTQLRVFDGLVETRHSILRLRPNFRNHWIALAIAYHLNGNLVGSKRVLEQYERTLRDIPDYDVEHSETLLYHVRVLEDLGEYEDALNILETGAKQRKILDRTATMEYRARILTKLKSPEAESAWHTLIEHNPDCYEYYKSYLSQNGLSLDLKDDKISEVLAILQSFSTRIPRATAPRRLALNLASGPTFECLVKPYILSALNKGIPSLFSDLKSLYSRTEASKQQTIQSIVEAELENPSDPSVHLWTLYYLAQHHSYLGNHVKALEVLDQAIAHTPTLPELFMFKGRVLKRCGDYLGAVKAVNEARLLDGQDRFLNTKTGKYLLRAGLLEEVNGVFGLFTKKDALSPGADLQDMQSFLYLLEEANAHRTNGKLHLALKKYMAVVKVIEDFEDDQYDFHGYNLRKFTVNIYLNLITWEDNLRSHPVYVTAALAASQILVAAHDNPSISTAVTTTPQLTDAEKKAKKKAKKAASKSEDNKKAQAANTNEDKGLEPPTKDDDPEGLKLIASKDGLEIAAKLLRPLTNLLSSGNCNVNTEDMIEVWLVSYDVAIRRNKLLQAVKALAHAKNLNPDCPGLHVRLVDIRQRLAVLPQIPPAPIGPQFISGVRSLIPGEEDISLETYNSQYLQRHAGDAAAVLAVARVQFKLGAPREDVEGAVFAELGNGVELNLAVALESLTFLREIHSERVDDFRERCKTRFACSTVFGTTEELVRLKESILVTSGENERGAGKEEIVP